MAIPGNHDHLVEEAFDFRKYGPRATSTKVGSQRQRLTPEEAERLREAYQTKAGEGWFFGQHGAMTVQVKGHYLKLLLSGLSHQRWTDRYSFIEDAVKDGDVWEEIKKGVDIVMTRGPAFDDMSKLKEVETALDRDCFNPKSDGSPSLRKAIDQAHIPLIVSGHIHSAYGYHSIPYSGGAEGLWVNPAVVIGGYDCPETMGPWDTHARLADYLTPRAPVIIRYNVKTRQSIVVSSDDTSGAVLRPWAKPVVRQSYVQGETDAEVAMRYWRSQNRRVTKDAARDWLKECKRDHDKRKMEEGEASTTN